MYVSFVKLSAFVVVPLLLDAVSSLHSTSTPGVAMVYRSPPVAKPMPKIKSPYATKKLDEDDTGVGSSCDNRSAVIVKEEVIGDDEYTELAKAHDEEMAATQPWRMADDEPDELPPLSGTSDTDITQWPRSDANILLVTEQLDDLIFAKECAETELRELKADINTKRAFLNPEAAEAAAALNVGKPARGGKIEKATQVLNMVRDGDWAGLQTWAWSKEGVEFDQWRKAACSQAKARHNGGGKASGSGSWTWSKSSWNRWSE